ncbi:MAG: hypothetical protein N2Z74_06730, partial [Syntrophales bacterium]|nr:hypothetical protein [Syntrophales bacterium]
MTQRITAKNLLAALMTTAVSLLWGCGQEDLIFFPETLPRDYRYHFAVPHEEIFIPVEGAVLNALYFQAPQA